MTRLSFPNVSHEHHVRNVNEVFDKQKTFGERAADSVANLVGSWRFILVQSGLLAIWLVVNSLAWIHHWDPYPFILMNLVLSTQAAFTAPIIMMSQNRQAKRDRLEAHNDYEVNLKSADNIRLLLGQLEAQNIALSTMHDLLVGVDQHEEAPQPPSPNP